MLIPRPYSEMGLSWWSDAQETNGLFCQGSAACAESGVDVPWQQSAIGNYLEQASRMGEPQPCGPRNDRFGLWRGNNTCSMVICYWGMHRQNGTPAGRLLGGQAEWAAGETARIWDGYLQPLGRGLSLQWSVWILSWRCKHLTPFKICFCRLPTSFICELGWKWERLPCRTL